eukprot:6591631-Prymnesium_polylepis.1
MPAARPCPPAVPNATATRADTALQRGRSAHCTAAHSNALRNASSTQLVCLERAAESVARVELACAHRSAEAESESRGELKVPRSSRLNLQHGGQCTMSIGAVGMDGRGPEANDRSEMAKTKRQR